MPKQTPLFEHHRRLGAHLTEFAGWTMPMRYSSDIAEHHAVRRAAGLFDLSHMGEVEVTGEGAAAALDYALVNKPSAMKPGEARYTMICAENGGILDDVVIYRLEANSYLIVANASNVETVSCALAERVAGHDAQVHNATEEWALIACQGPASNKILAGVTDVDVSHLKYYSIVGANMLGSDVLLARTGYTGENGFEIYCRPEQTEQLWLGLIKEGAPHGLVPAGLACRDTLRLEAGMSLYGQELNADITPFEAGLGRLVNFTKDSDFVGRTTLVARREAGASQTLVGMVARGRRCPRPNYHVFDPVTDRQVGRVTSGAPSPTLGHPIAIALVPVQFQAVGTRLLVDVRGVREDVEVVSLPFYHRDDR